MVLDKKNLDQSIHLLEGLLKGIAFDQRINDKEISELNHWIAAHENARRHYPYTVLIPLLSTVLADHIITEDEKQDILWFCDKVSTENYFYDIVFSDLQRLKGIIHGILSDKVIRDEEIHALEGWLKENTHLKNYYPYDELVAVIDAILEDQIVTSRERQLLERYFIEFINKEMLSSYSQDEVQTLKAKITIGAVCAKKPIVNVKGKHFALTGQQNTFDRQKFVEYISSKGGYYHQQVTDIIDYLIVCDTNALLWAFEPYGRKIDQALDLRSQGHALVILHKKDFLKAL